jgi:aminoglycoside phosphotransferase (APT) family kinase protein
MLEIYDARVQQFPVSKFDCQPSPGHAGWGFVTDDRLHAVLIEPQLAHFRELCGLVDEPLQADFSGWHRHAISSGDRIFLFPRHRRWVRGLLIEKAALQAIEGRGVPAPRVIGCWRDDAVSPYPFVGMSRLPGVSWGRLGQPRNDHAPLADWLTVMENLGRAIATWHLIDPAELPASVRRGSKSLTEFTSRFTPSAIDESTQRAAAAAELPTDVAGNWARILRPLAAMRRVLVHGDVHEGQILVDDALDITGIIDWETACVGHPLKDFDFGEWGFEIFALEAHFAGLRRTLWRSYSRARGGDLPDWRAVHLFYCVKELAYFSRRPMNDDWTRQRFVRAKHLLRTFEG